MKQRYCRRCDQPVGADPPPSCPVCGLGEPDLERPLAVDLAVLIDAVAVPVLVGVAAAGLLVGAGLERWVGQVVTDAMAGLGGGWVVFGVALAAAFLLLLDAVGLARGRRWGPRLQLVLATAFMPGGVAIMLWAALLPPAEPAGQAARWTVGLALTGAGFLWTAFLGRLRPRTWFRTVAEHTSG